MPDTLDDLVAELQSTPPKDKRTRCYTANWLESLTDERTAAFQGALDNPRWKTIDIYDLAVKAGYDRLYNTLRNHRVGSCSCGR